MRSYRKRLGSRSLPTPKVCPEAFPIKASDHPLRIRKANPSPLITRVIDERHAHHLGCEGVEMLAVFPHGLVMVQEPNVEFVDEARGLNKHLDYVIREFCLLVQGFCHTCVAR